MPHGIYYYDYKRKDWLLLRKDGEPLKPGELGDGLYVIYFYNLMCGACRAFTPHWMVFAEVMAGKLDNVIPLVVLCDWFSSMCDSKAAGDTFNEFDVDSTPTVIMVKVKGGSIIDKSRLSGVVSSDDLFKIAKRYAKL